jgi:hypothetical protein
MSFHNFQILTHRPFLCLFDSLSEHTQSAERQRLEVAISAASVCRKSSFEIMRLCTTYRQHYTVQCVVFMVAHYLTNVCTIHIVDRDNESSAIAENAETGLLKCFEILEEMSEVWEVAQKAIALVKELKANRENRGSTSMGRFGISENNLQRNESQQRADAIPDPSVETHAHSDGPQNLSAQLLGAWDIGLMFPSPLFGQGSFCS